MERVIHTVANDERFDPPGTPKLPPLETPDDALQSRTEFHNVSGELPPPLGTPDDSLRLDCGLGGGTVNNADTSQLPPLGTPTDSLRTGPDRSLTTGGDVPALPPLETPNDSLGVKNDPRFMHDALPFGATRR